MFVHKKIKIHFGLLVLLYSLVANTMFGQSSKMGHSKTTGTVMNATLLNIQYYVVDSDVDVGMYSSIACDNSNQLHFSYYDNINKNLKYATGTNNSYQLQVIADVGDVGKYTSIAIDNSDNVNIIYYDATRGKLKYAGWLRTWEYDTVDAAGDVGQYSSITMNTSNQPSISYYDATNDDLKVATFNGTSWDKQIVDSDGDRGRYSSYVIDIENNPNLIYYDATRGKLKYAGWLRTWEYDTVDAAGDVGQYSSITMNTANHPSISYYDATNDDLKVATYNGTSWDKQIVDSDGDRGRYSSYIIDAENKPNLIYYDATRGKLKYAGWLRTWEYTTVDATGDVGQYNSLACDASNQIHISYYDVTNANLKFASLINDTWQTDVVASEGSVGRYTSLAISKPEDGNKAHVIFYDQTEGELQCAIKNLPLANVGSIAGIVTDVTSGLPIFDANITIVHYANSLTYGMQTSDTGTYEIKSIPPGVYTTKASKNNYSQQTKPYIVVNTGSTTQVDFVLEDNSIPEGCVLEGSIEDIATLLQLEGAQISLIPSVPGGTAISNQNGFWQMQGIQPGLGYELEIVRTGYDPVHITDINLETGQTYTIDYQLSLQISYLSYRIAPISIAPNPPTIEVPIGGTGYAWFVLEGETSTGNWLPVPAAEVQIIDEQGNPVYDKNGDLVKTDFLFYKFLTSPFHMQNIGVFGVPIESEIIQDGSVGSVELITVIGANGETIPVQNQQSVVAEIVPYEINKNWGYRIYAKGGLGVGGATGIARANGFVGGGAGATLNVKFNDPKNTTDWSSFRIMRKNDLFAGVEASVGPPKLLVADVGVSAGITATMPYQDEYDFDMDALGRAEAILAFYLFYEPTILYAGSAHTVSQIGVNFLSWLVDFLIDNHEVFNYDVMRISEASGLDIEGKVNAGVDLGFDISEKLNLGISGNMGANAHFGSFIQEDIYETKSSTFYLGGGYDASVDIGPKFLSKNKIKSQFIYPFRMNQTLIPSSLDIEFRCTNVTSDGSWQHIDLETSLESNSQALNYYNLPGERQKYSVQLKVDNDDMHNWLTNVSEIPSEVANIGATLVDITINDNTFKEDYESFLEKVYNEQKNDASVVLDYAIKAEDKNEYEIDMSFQIPFPLFPPLDIVVGGGYKSSEIVEYNIAEGYWAKGLPYFRTELPSPVNPDIDLYDVMSELWQRLLLDELFYELKELILERTIFSKFIKWLQRSATTQIVPLNELGSIIEIRENSIPASIDSLFCRQWDWGEEPIHRSKTADEINRYRKYINALRKLREEAVGMHYGIGGFYSFEPAVAYFGDSTFLTIAYTDTMVAGFDETSLSMYWEDTLGIWHPLESYNAPDSNKVSAWIDHFATYTLAPRMPQGEYGLQTIPYSIPSDGISTALISSPTLLNNDSTQISDGMLFTIETSRGTILTEDSEPGIEGIQVQVQNGIIQFNVQSDSIAIPIQLYAKSIQGFAKCEGVLILFDTIPPSPPTNLWAILDNKSVKLFWDEVPEPDIASYKVYFDADNIIPPYEGISTVWGEPSPIQVGNTNNHHVFGLYNDTTYYFAVTAIDVAGNESDYSIPISKVLKFTPQTLDLQNITINNSQSECYNATDTITVAGSGTTVDINSGGDATFIAGEKIIFEPGFKAHPGSYVNAYITTSGDYCNSLPPMAPSADITFDESDEGFNIYEDENQEISIYPNPTTGLITIDFMGKATKANILILNFQGNQMRQVVCDNQAKVEFDISILPSGIYIVVIKTETQIVSRKIIKAY